MVRFPGGGRVAEGQQMVPGNCLLEEVEVPGQQERGAACRYRCRRARVPELGARAVGAWVAR